MDQKAIREYFERNRSRLVDDICRLVRIDSSKSEPLEGRPFGEGPAAVLAEALKIAEEMGLRTKNYDNYAGAVDISDQPKQLEILAHLDVVPAGEGWSVTQPFVPVVADGKLYGRGSADDKGPAIAALYALKAVRDLNVPLRGNARLVLGTDEECGSGDMRYYFRHEPEAPMTFSPDADFPLVNLEKGSFSDSFEAHWEKDDRLPRVVSVDGGIKGNVVPGRATAVIDGLTPEQAEAYAAAAGRRTGLNFHVRAQDGRVVIEATGVFAHASTPEIGNNAVTGMIGLLADMPFADSDGFRRLCAVHMLFPHGDWTGKSCGVEMSDQISGRLTMTLNIFHFSQTGLSGWFDSRTPVCATNENVRDVMKARTASLGLELKDMDMLPAHHVPEDSPLIRTLLRCYEQYSGRKGKCLAIGGGTYVHHIKNGVAFGCAMPGTENRMHGPDEFAVVDHMVVSAEIFTQAIIDLCGE